MIERLQRTALIFSGFAPGATVNLVTINPNGGLDSQTTTTADGNGRGNIADQYATEDPQRHPAGVYTTTLRNPSTGAEARCTVRVVGP